MKNPYKRTTYKGHPIDEHRKVVEQFLGRKLKRSEIVHHINGDKKDNRIENLQIMTQAEHNRLHKEKLPKVKICIVCGKPFEPPVKHRARNLTCSPECCRIHLKEVSPFQDMKIKQFDKDGNYIKTFNSIKQASEEIGGYSTNIIKCMKGITKTAYGYKWEYVVKPTKSFKKTKQQKLQEKLNEKN